MMPHLTAFDVLLPALLKAFESVQTDAAYQALAEPIKVLAAWDKNSSASSIAETVAIEWAQKIWPTIQRGTGPDDTADQVEKSKRFAATASAPTLFAATADNDHRPGQKIRNLAKTMGRYQPLSKANREPE